MILAPVRLKLAMRLPSWTILRKPSTNSVPLRRTERPISNTRFCLLRLRRLRQYWKMLIRWLRSLMLEVSVRKFGHITPMVLIMLTRIDVRVRPPPQPLGLGRGWVVCLFI
ncbi:MAG: hypothetical protein [Protegovirus mintis]|uniref:Uncharacterized protein n=1 Tax=Cressdnaviricota sp. TaxID=2748378 RepID=A0A345N0X0_9VIRU|nr:MAG: hypothetical protein [Cressdnaviricota sp.]